MTCYVGPRKGGNKDIEKGNSESGPEETEEMISSGETLHSKVFITGMTVRVVVTYTLG